MEQEVAKDIVNDIEDTQTTNEYELADIWKAVLASDGIIIEIYGQDQGRLRKGLSTMKSRMNAKYKESNLPTDDRTLQFDVLATDEKTKIIKLRIWLKDSDKYQIKSLIKLDGELAP